MKTFKFRATLRRLTQTLASVMLIAGGTKARAAQDYDLTRDFSTNANPNGAWSYGWKQTLGSPLNVYTHVRTAFGANGVPLQVLEDTLYSLPDIHFNATTNTTTSDGGQGQYPPRTLWYYPGDKSPANFGVIRFTAPSNSIYEVGVAVRSYLDGSSSGDTDFYVVRNSAEVVGWFLPSRGGTNYTNTLTLRVGETLDFVVGRGADDNLFGSGLKIAALITPTINSPIVTNPPCTFVFSPSNGTHSAVGGTGSVAVATQAGCSWSVFSTNAWIHVGPFTNVGSGTMIYLVDTNASTLTRSGFIRIDGQNYLVNQAGAPSTNSPPVVYADFDLSRDFTTNSNPDGVWSYGWKTNVGGAFSLLPSVYRSAHPNGTPYDVRALGYGTQPLIEHHPLSNTNNGISATGTFPPGTLVLDPGPSAPQNLVVVRFTAPSNGNYRVESAATPGFDGAPQGDTDFHVIRNGTELFGRFLAPTQRTGYTNVLALIAGDIVDFAVGRGADNSESGSILKLAAIITPTTNTPVVTNPPPVYADFNVSRDFSTNSNPDGVWSYGWKTNLGGGFSLLNGVRRAAHPNAVPIDLREYGVGTPPLMMHHPLSNTNDGLSGGTGHFPPGTLLLDPGMNAPQNLVAVRFTAPSNGNYRVETAAAPGFDGSPQGDTDFHKHPATSSTASTGYENPTFRLEM